MKNRNLKLALAAALFTSGGMYAQKMYETSAALEYNTFEMCFMQAAQAKNEKAMLECRENYDKAKDYIDKAASNETTMNSAKTLFYKGKIYIGSMMAYATDTVYQKENLEKNLNTGIESLKKAYQDKKFKQDVTDYVGTYVFQFNMGASQMFNEKKYLEAGGLYEMAYRFNDVVGKVDSTSLYNSGIAYQAAGKHEEAAEKFKKLAEIGYKPGESYANAITNLVDAKKLDEVKGLIEEAIKKYPNDKDVLIAGVNYYFNVNDMESAQQLLDKAVQQDPNNYVLLYNIGTITLSNGDFDKAESSLKRAVEIKPDYYDAQYQLGAVYVNKYAAINEKLDNMKTSDPKVKELETEAKETIQKAIAPLEKYLSKFPNDKQTLLNMTKIYRAIGNNEKAIEYKKRADAVQ